MADQILLNKGNLTGTYNGLDFNEDSTEATTVLVDGFTITKTADKEVWADGILTYTITITNGGDHDLEGPVFSDLLDITKVNIVEDSVYVDGAIKTYTFVGGLLTVNLDTIAVGQTVVITFQVTKI